MGGGQSREIFRGGPVKKITLYLIIPEAICHCKCHLNYICKDHLETKDHMHLRQSLSHSLR